MEDILIEREFDAPQVYDDFQGASAKAPGCLERYRATYRGSYVALDGRRMLCHLVAPDAQSVRTPSEMYDVPFTRIWTAAMERGPGAPEDRGPMALVAPATETGDATPHRIVVVVEKRFDTPVKGSEAVAAAERALGSRATHIWSYVQRGGGSYFGIFDAEDPHGIAATDGFDAWLAAVRTKKVRRHV